MKNIAFILAGGAGCRFGSKKPKQYHLLNGKEMVWYSITALQKASSCDSVFVVCPKQDKKYLESRYGVPCIDGGKTRNESLYQGLCYIKQKFPDCKNVFIQEAARPMLTPTIVNTYLARLEEYDSVITAAHLSDSLGQYGKHITLRQQYYLIQAPEAFRFGVLFAHFDPQSPLTATVQQMPEGSRMLRFFDFCDNIKVTYPQDLLVAEYLIKHREGLS